MMLTIFTALYNRKEYLSRIYTSLQKQDCKDFEWLIVDDGSTDFPEELILEWKKSERSFPIRYFKKENGGKHTATNIALPEAAGDYFMFLDSDDYLTDFAVSHIKEWVHFLPEQLDERKILGISGQKINQNGEYLIWRTGNNGRQIPYGGSLPFSDTLMSTMVERFEKYGIRGDCCEIFRTEILRKYPFPVFPGENFLSEDAIYFPISKDGWKIIYYREPLEVCEYQEQGLSFDADKFIKNPKGWGYVIRVKECTKEERSEREFEYFLKLSSTLPFHVICENLGITDATVFREMLLNQSDIRIQRMDDIKEALCTYSDILKQLDRVQQSSVQHQTILRILEELKKLLTTLDAEITFQLTNHGIDSAKAITEERKKSLIVIRKNLLSQIDSV